MQAIHANSVTMTYDSINSLKKQDTLPAGTWMALVTCSLCAYHLGSDGDFSFLMTLSSICSAFGMVMLCMQFLNAKSVAGISLKTLQLHSLAFFCRFVSTLFHEGYLPLDKSGDFIYRGAELVSVAACAFALYMAYRCYCYTYEAGEDNFGDFGPTCGDRAKYGAVWIVAPALVLSFLIHPSLNNVAWSDVAWTFALYVDVLAVAPQLFMFHKTGGTVASYTSHYVFSLGFGRVAQLLFWSFSYHELSSSAHGGFAGVFVMLSQTVGAFLMADFFYYYAKCQNKGSPMTLPSVAELV